MTKSILDIIDTPETRAEHVAYQRRQLVTTLRALECEIDRVAQLSNELAELPACFLTLGITLDRAANEVAEAKAEVLDRFFD